MADQKVTISITTLGNTAGADAVSKSLKNVSVSAGTLNDKVSVSTWGVYDLDKAVTKTAGSAGKVPAVVDAAGASTKKWGFLANQAGVQLGDLTTQVSMGTSAVRAFSMQAPQMLGMMSAAGVMSAKMALAMTGIGAAIPLALMAAPALMSFLSGTAEKADDAAEKMKGMGDRLAGIESKHTSKIIQDLEDAEERSRTLDKSTSIVRTAQENAAKAQLTNAGKLAKAEENINVILGIRVDRFKQIREENERAAQARQKELKIAQDAANEEAAAEQREIERIQATKAGQEARLEELKRRQANDAKFMSGLQRNRGDQTRAVDEEPATFIWDTWMGKKMYDPETAKAKQKAADDARSLLPGTEAMISEKGKQIAARDEEIRRLERTVAQKETAIDAKKTDLAATAKAANINLEQLVENQEVDQTLEMSETARKQNEILTNDLTTLRDDLQKAAENQGGLSMSAARALSLLNETLANNQVDPKEVNMVREAMAQLLVSNEAVKGAIIGGFSRLHQENITMRAQLSALEKQFSDIKRNQP